MNAIIYTRVSTKEQAQHGFSLNRQAEECKRFAHNCNFDITAIFVEEGASAKTQRRPELEKLKKYCLQNKKNIDAIIVWKIDRLTRNMGDFYLLSEFFKSLDIKLLSVTEINDDTPIGKFSRTITGAVSQFENDQKSERVTAGMKQAVYEGYWLWCPPKGYIKNGRLMVPNPKYAPAIKEAFEKFATGLFSQTELISLLQRNGLKANGNFIGRTLRNPLYCGVIKHKWLEQPIKGKIEPIVSEELFIKVQEILDGKKSQITGYNRNNPDFPLRQFLTCPNCNQPLTGGWSKGNAKEKFAYYHCYNKDCDCKLRVRADILNKIFPEYLKTIKPEQHLIELYQAVLKDVHKQNTKELSTHLECLNRKLSQAQERKDKLLDMYMDEKVSEIDYRRKTEQLENDIRKIKAELIQTPPLEDDFNAYVDYACAVIANIDEMWLKGSLDLRQRIQRLIFPKGITYDLENFRTNGMANIFTKIGAFKAPYNEMVLPRGFEPLSHP